LAVVLGFSPHERKETSVDANRYDGYAGTYQISDFRITIVRDGDRLFAEVTGQKHQLFPESVHDYFFKAFDAQLTFVTDPDGRATELIFHEGGADTHLARVQ
jgi:hypothetical protein